MALEEQPREDLMREAVAYAKRSLLKMATFDEPVFWGQRRDGAWSIYFGEDPVFQFNGKDELRRAYFESCRYAAKAHRLYRLEKPLNGGQVQLSWIEDAKSERVIQQIVVERFAMIMDQLRSNSIEVLQTIPANENPLPTIAQRLQAFVLLPKVANSPSA